jgi:hypothetical protein
VKRRIQPILKTNSAVREVKRLQSPASMVTRRRLSRISLQDIRVSREQRTNKHRLRRHGTASGKPGSNVGRGQQCVADLKFGDGDREGTRTYGSDGTIVEVPVACEWAISKPRYDQQTGPGEEGQPARAPAGMETMLSACSMFLREAIR